MPDLDALNGTGHPIGLIVMWSGFLNQIPAGYLLADGNNGTPDLIAFFLRGNPPSGVVGAEAGADTHVLTTAELPPHTHSVSGLGHRHEQELSTVPVAGGSTGLAGNANAGTYLFKNVNASVTLSLSGNSQPHENRPPYYELAFIQKVSN